MNDTCAGYFGHLFRNNQSENDLPCLLRLQMNPRCAYNRKELKRYQTLVNPSSVKGEIYLCIVFLPL
jgi:hypothetical protein